MSTIWRCHVLFSLVAQLTIVAGQPGASYRPAPCAFEVPHGAVVECGWLTVPENRSKPGGRAIRLHVARYKSRALQPAPDPILWLVGGPGGRANLLASRLFARVVEPYLGKRDFIVVDIRGTGYSEPSLDCPNRDGPAADWVRACAQRLSPIADLSYYHSAAAAADLADLRRALGVREWNLLGESYGTRLALTAVRDHPEGIRSIVLDSVVPVGADQYGDGPSNFEKAINALFAGCAADPQCHAAFPEPGPALLIAADRLDRSPRRLAGTWHGTPYDFRLDGRQLMEALHMALYESDIVPRVPWAIYHAVDGSADTVWSEVLARHNLFVFRSMVDQGAFLSFHCREAVPFTDIARLKTEDAAQPWARHVASGLGIVETCRSWPSGRPDPRESRPVASAIPALLLAGEYDPVTPPSNAKSAAAHLSHSQRFVFPGLGHWLTANTVTNCPQSIVLQFLDAPGRLAAPRCLEEWKPRWEYR